VDAKKEDAAGDGSFARIPGKCTYTGARKRIPNGRGRDLPPGEGK